MVSGIVPRPTPSLQTKSPLNSRKPTLKASVRKCVFHSNRASQSKVVLLPSRPAIAAVRKLTPSRSARKFEAKHGPRRRRLCPRPLTRNSREDAARRNTCGTKSFLGPPGQPSLWGGGEPDTLPHRLSFSRRLHCNSPSSICPNFAMRRRFSDWQPFPVAGDCAIYTVGGNL